MNNNLVSSTNIIDNAIKINDKIADAINQDSEIDEYKIQKIDYLVSQVSEMLEEVQEKIKRELTTKPW